MLKLDPGVRPGYLAFDPEYARIIEARIRRVRSGRPFPGDAGAPRARAELQEPQLRLAI